MNGVPPSRPQPADPRQLRARRSWQVLAGALLVVGAAVLLNLVTDPRPWDLLVAAGTILVAVAAVLHRRAVHALEADRRVEAESVARILQGLSRSVSGDAIVDAIVGDLATATRADHVVVARRRPGELSLEATLVGNRRGAPSTTMRFPLADLDASSVEPVEARSSVGRARIAIPVLAGAVASRVAAPPPTSLHAVPGGPWAAPRPSMDGEQAPDLSVPGAVVAERLATRARFAYGLRNTLAAPLVGPGGVMGAIILSRSGAEPWAAGSRRILAGAAMEASAALSRAESHHDAETRAATDVLTGLPNRRYFDEFCALLARRRRAQDAVGVLMIDIDQFKALNDRHGHATGDRVLQAVGGALARAVRDADLPARYGGEEFVVLLRSPGREVSAEVGERVRRAVAELELHDLGVGRVTVSVGVAVAGHANEAIAEIVQRADVALYEAKRRGRNRVVLS